MIHLWIMASTQSRREELGLALRNDAVHVLGAATTFSILRSLIAERPADVVVVDIRSTPEPDVIREWLAEFQELAALVLLIPEYDADIVGVILQAKTGGILRSDAAPEQLIHAVQSVVSGLMILDAAVALPVSSDEVFIEPLTSRETEVLRLLADGLGNKEIAARLSISEHTIKFHIRSILSKLGASSRTEAVTRGLRSGLIDL